MTISRRIGHANAATTLRVYGYLFEQTTERRWMRLKRHSAWEGRNDRQGDTQRIIELLDRALAADDLHIDTAWHIIAELPHVTLEK